MPRLTWDSYGERFFESGIDRGVLYLANEPGVAWPGLISISETPTGGDTRPYYIDGIKYLNLAQAEEFEARLDAYSAPAEFGPCDGIASIQNGLFVTQQPKTAFGLAYRTRIGNDIDGEEHGYKIHLVYNALAESSQRTHNTSGETASAEIMSWNISTLPPLLTGHRPTSHFVIDSRYTPNELLTDIENDLYGSPETASRLPTVQELVDRFQSWN